MFRLLRCRTTRPFLARVVALLLAAPLFFYLFVFDLPDVAPRERTVVLPAPGNDARSLVERRWAAFLSCVEETPCPAQAKIMRSPPSYSAAKEHFLEMYAATASLRNVSAHGYGGFGGPWLENLFVEAADKYAMALFERFYPVIPLIMQSTDICVQHHHLRDPIKRLLRTGLRPEFIYAFASQHDNGLCSWEGGEGIPLDPCTSVPPNLLHFSAGGYGNSAWAQNVLT